MTEPKPGETRQFGEQIAWIEEPDIFGMRLTGEVDGPSLEGLLAFQSAWAETKEQVFILCDLSRVRRATTESRRVMHETRIPKSVTTHVCFGASFSVRIFAEMVVRGARFLGTTPPGMVVVFFTNEAEARAYIERVRASRRGRRK